MSRKREQQIWMGEHDDEELQRAFRMSLQPVPDAKRSKPRDNALLSSPSPATPCSASETADARNRRLLREVLAAAAEQRRIKSTVWGPSPGVIDASTSSSSHSKGVNDSRSPTTVAASVQDRVPGSPPQKSCTRDLGEKSARGKRRVDDDRQYLPYRLAEQLYTMVFGTSFSRDVLAQWCNQGFRLHRGSHASPLFLCVALVFGCGSRVVTDILEGLVYSCALFSLSCVASRSERYCSNACFRQELNSLDNFLRGGLIQDGLAGVPGLGLSYLDAGLLGTFRFIDLLSMRQSPASSLMFHL